MNNQVSNATTTSTVGKVFHDDVAGMVDELFKNLIASCPVLLNIDSVQLKRIKQQWILGFQEQGVNNFEMVKCGMREARAKPNGYLPSVGEFIAWCKKKLQSARISHGRPAISTHCGVYGVRYGRN
ncbi:hypothetical protein O1Q83_01064 [Lonepinella koalarum]